MFFGDPLINITNLYSSYFDSMGKKTEKTNTLLTNQGKIIKTIEQGQKQGNEYLKLISEKKEGSGGSSNKVSGSINAMLGNMGSAASISIVSLGLYNIAKALKLIDNNVEDKALKFTLAIYYLLKSVETVQNTKGIANPVKVFASMEAARFITYYAGVIIDEINNTPLLDHGISGVFNINKFSDSKFSITTESKLFSSMITLIALEKILEVFKSFNEVYDSVSISSSIMFSMFGTTGSMVKMVGHTIEAIEELPILDHGIKASIDLNNLSGNQFSIKTDSKLFNAFAGVLATAGVLKIYGMFLKTLDSEVLKGGLISKIISIRLMTPWIIGTIRVAIEEFQHLISPAKKLMVGGGKTDIGKILGLGNTGLKVPNVLVTIAAVSLVMSPIAKGFSALASIPGIWNIAKIGLMYLTIPIMIYTLGGAIKVLNNVDIGKISSEKLTSLIVKLGAMQLLSHSLIPISQAFGNLLQILVTGRRQAVLSRLADAGIYRYVFSGRGMTSAEFFGKSGGQAKSSTIFGSFAAIILTVYALTGVIYALNLIQVKDGNNLVKKSLAVTILAYAMSPLMESFLNIYSTIWNQSDERGIDIVKDKNLKGLLNKKQKQKLILGKIPIARILVTTIIAGVVTTAMAGILTMVMPKLFKAGKDVGPTKNIIRTGIAIYFASLALGVVVKSFIRIYEMLNNASTAEGKASVLTDKGNLMTGKQGKANRKFNMVKDAAAFLKMMAILPAFAVGLVGVGAVFKLFGKLEIKASDAPPISWIFAVGSALYVFAKVFAVVMRAISKAKIDKGGMSKMSAAKGVSGFAVSGAIATIIGLSVGIVAVATVMNFMPKISPAIMSSMVFIGIGLTFLSIPLVLFSLVIARVIKIMGNIKIKKLKTGSLIGGDFFSNMGKMGEAVMVIIAATLSIALIAFVLNVIPIVSAPIPPQEMILQMIPALLVIGMVALIITPIYKAVSKQGILDKAKGKGGLIGGILNSPLIKVIALLAVATFAVAMISMILGNFDWSKLSKIKPPSPEFLMGLVPTILVIGFVAGILAIVSKLAGKTGLGSVAMGGLILVVAGAAFLALSWILTYMPEDSKLRILPKEWVVAQMGIILAVGTLGAILGLIAIIAKKSSIFNIMMGGIILIAAGAAILALSWIFSYMPKDSDLRIFPEEWIKNQEKLAIMLGTIGAVISFVGMIASRVSPLGMALGIGAIVIGTFLILGIGYALSLLPGNMFGSGSNFNSFVDSMVYMGEEVAKMLIRVINYGLASLVDTFVTAMLKLFSLFGYDPNRDKDLAMAALKSGGTVVLGDQINVAGNYSGKKSFIEQIIDKIPEIKELLKTISSISSKKGLDIMGGLLAVSAGLSAFLMIMGSQAGINLAASVLDGIAGTIRWLTGTQEEAELKDPLRFLHKLIDNSEKVNTVAMALVGVAAGMGAIVKASKTSISTKNVTSFINYIDEFLSQSNKNKLKTWTYWDGNRQSFRKTKNINKLVAFSQVMQSIGSGLFGLVREDKKFLKIVKSFKELSVAIIDMVDAINKLNTEKVVSLNKQFDKIQELADSNAIKKIEEQKSFTTKTGELFSNIGESLGLKQKEEEEEKNLKGKESKLKNLTKGDLDSLVKELSKRIASELMTKFGENSGGKASIRTSLSD